MELEQIDAHVKEITRYQNLINETPKENKRKRIELLAEQLVYVGKLAAEFSGEYKDAYVSRKQAIAEAENEATKNKATAGELAGVEWRKKEAEAYRNMKRWDNAFTSTREQLHALKFDVNIDIQDGSSKIGS